MAPRDPGAATHLATTATTANPPPPTCSSSAFALLSTQLQSCCGASNQSCPTRVAPEGCLWASQATCIANWYLKNGVCSPCGNGTTSTGGAQASTCGEGPFAAKHHIPQTSTCTAALHH
jgi:hypothetical protein